MHPIHNVYDGVFNAISGIKIDLNNPTPDMIRLDDIASCLSKICRFGGHIGQLYSVAQHTVIVAELAPKELRREALLHDAAEAYLGDVIKPLKVLLGDAYAHYEDKFNQVIIDKYKLDPANLALVKKYDDEALFIENEHLKKGNSTLWNEAMSRMKFNGKYAATWPYYMANTVLKGYFDFNFKNFK